MRIVLPPPAWLRALCIGAFAAMLAQIFFLYDAALVERLHGLAWDKLSHALAYGALALVFWFAVGFTAPAAAWLAIAAIGALDEAHQFFHPARTADVLDVLADAVGAALVIVFLESRRSPCAESWAPSRGATSSPSSSRA